MSKNDSNTITAKKRERIEWMDGLKGLVCLIVFFGHSVHLFYPAYHFGDEFPSHLNGWETKLYYSPFRLIMEARINVSVFFILSGIVLALQIMNMADVKEKLPGVIFKRYFRLMIPVAPMGVIVWLLSKFNLLSNIPAAAITGSKWAKEIWMSPISFSQMVSSVLVRTWFYGDDTVSTALWVMSQLFYGSYLVILLATLYWKMKGKSIWAYLFAFLCIVPRHDHMGAMVLGLIIALMVKENIVDFPAKLFKSKVLVNLAGPIMIFIALLFGGYPDFLEEPLDVYRYVNIGNPELYYNVGSFFMVLGIYNCKPIKDFLCQKVFKFLGSICYEILIVHAPILLSLGTSIFLFCNSMNIDYNLSVIIVWIVVIPFGIAFAWIYNRYVGRFANYCIKKVTDYLES